MTPSIQEYQIGDEVRIDLEQDDIDQRYDGMIGKIVEIGEDDLGGLTGDPEDDNMYTIELRNGEIPSIHFRYRDLQPLE